MFVRLFCWGVGGVGWGCTVGCLSPSHRRRPLVFHHFTSLLTDWGCVRIVTWLSHDSPTLHYVIKLISFLLWWWEMVVKGLGWRVVGGGGGVKETFLILWWWLEGFWEVTVSVCARTLITVTLLSFCICLILKQSLWPPEGHLYHHGNPSQPQTKLSGAGEVVGQKKKC